MGTEAIRVSEIRLPGQQEYENGVFPLVKQCTAGQASLQDTVDWIFDESDRHPTSEPDDRTLVLVRA